MSGAGELALLGTVLGASVLGSVHCVGMCGGFVAATCGAGRSGARELGPLWAYQGARLLAYTGLGALAGALGSGLDHGGALLGVSRLAGPLMGVTLVAMAAASWFGREPSAQLIALGRGPRRPGLLARLRLRLTQLAMRREGSGLLAGAATGLLSAMLPCGWLWTYVAAAAATGRAGLGALVMLCFGLGSVPALLGVGLLADGFRRRLGAHAPKLAAALMLGLGLLALFGKLDLPAAPSVEPTSAYDEPTTEPDPQPSPPAKAPCH